MNKYYLIKTEYNWADEADFPSWALLDEKRWNKIKSDITSYFDHPDSQEFLVSVGTNEEIEFSNIDDVFWGLEETILTEQEAAIIRKAFNTSDYGACSITHVHDYAMDRMRELDPVEEEDLEGI